MESGSALALLLLLILLCILLRTATLVTLPTSCCRCCSACGGACACACAWASTTRTALVIPGIVDNGDLVDTAVANVRPLVVADEVEVLGVGWNFEDLAVPLAIRGVNAESRDRLVGGALPQRHLIRVLPEANEDIHGRWAVQIGAGNRRGLVWRRARVEELRRTLIWTGNTSIAIARAGRRELPCGISTALLIAARILAEVARNLTSAVWRWRFGRWCVGLWRRWRLRHRTGTGRSAAEPCAQKGGEVQ